MQQVTKQLISKLEEVDWFFDVGQPIKNKSSMEVLDWSITSQRVSVAFDSWEAAIESSHHVVWENAILEASNKMRDKLIQNQFFDRFDKWNEIVREIKGVVQRVVERKFEWLNLDENLKTSLNPWVVAVIVSCCLESEYSDLLDPGFFVGLAFWYLQGHYPCGWLGEFPYGELLIY